MRRVAFTAAGFEATHDVGAGALASGWRALALFHHHARLVVRDGHVAVDGDQVVWGPAIATACFVHLERERRGTRVLATFDLGASGRQGGVAEAVFSAVLHVETNLFWTVFGDLERPDARRQSQTQDGSLHCNPSFAGLRSCRFGLFRNNR